MSTASFEVLGCFQVGHAVCESDFIVEAELFQEPRCQFPKYNVSVCFPKGFYISRCMVLCSAGTLSSSKVIHPACCLVGLPIRMEREAWRNQRVIGGISIFCCQFQPWFDSVNNAELS